MVDPIGIEDKNIHIGKIEIPQDWRICRLSEIFTIQQGKALSKKCRTGKCSYPFLRTANILWGRLDLSSLDEMDFTEQEKEKYRLIPGDLLVCEGGDIGRTSIWRGELQNCYYQNHIHRLRAKSGDIIPEFFMFWMQAAIKIFRLYQGEGNITVPHPVSWTQLWHKSRRRSSLTPPRSRSKPAWRLEGLGSRSSR